MRDDSLIILSMPGRNHQNRYFEFFSDALAHVGVEVIDVRDARARSFRFDVLHLHFPTHFITQTKPVAAIAWTVILASFITITKLLRKRIVYTVHNVVPFTAKRRWLVMPYLRLVHRLSDAFVFLNATSQAEFYATFPHQEKKRFDIIPHGPYPVTLMTTRRKSELREQLFGREEALVVGFLGTVKRYKGMEMLAALPSAMPDGRKLKVLVAGKMEGEFETDGARILERLTERSVVRIDRAISDAEFDEFLQVVDVVFMPYSKGWNSGAALLALSNRACISASHLPVFRDLERALGAPWVRCFDRSATPAEALTRSIVASFPLQRPTIDDEQRLTAFLKDVGFDNGAKKFRKLYDDVLRRVPSGLSVPGSRSR